MRKLFTLLIAFHLLVLPIPAQAAGIPGMKQITGIAVASVGLSLVGACGFKSPSILMYIAGAAIFLMGEMGGAKAQQNAQEVSNEELKKLKDSKIKGGDVQLAALEAQLKDKEEKLKLAKKRSAWSKAAGLLMIAAGALAATEWLLPPPVCNSATAIVIGKVKSAAIIGAYSFLSGGGIMGALLGVAAGVVIANGVAANLMNTPPSRGAVMAVGGGLVLAAGMEAGGEARKLQDDITLLKEVIAQFKNETNGKGPNTEDTSGGVSGGELAGTTSGSSSGVSSGSGSGASLRLLPTGQTATGKTTCLNAQQEFTTNCSNPLRFQSPSFKGFEGQLDLQQVASTGIQMANDAASGNISGADIGAASINASAAKINQAVKNNFAKANARLKAEGKPSIEKQQEDILKSMQSSFDKEMQGKEQSLAAAGLSNLKLDPAAEDKSGQNIAGASTESAIAVPTAKGDAAAAVDPALNANSAVSAEEMKLASESAKDALGNNLNEFESSEEDISKNKEDTLWKQVSNRYLLNYERFFERNKGPAPSQ